MMHVCLTYLSACSQLYSFLCGYAVAGVEYGCRGNGSEHGHVLQAHQRWAFFSCRTSTAFHIYHSEMEQPVKHRVCWRMQIYVHMQCSTCTGSLLTASRGDKKGEKRVTGPKGLSEGKHRIRGNKRITNMSRWHVYLLGIVWKIGERDKKVNLVKGRGKERAAECCARFTSGILLTSGQAAVGATQIDAAVRDGRDAKLVIGTGEKGCESAGKNKVPLTGSASHGNTDLKQEFKESHISLCAVNFRAGGESCLESALSLQPLRTICIQP